MNTRFDFNIRIEDGDVFVYPLEEKQLLYLCETHRISKFDHCFMWFPVTWAWVIRATHVGWRFCQSF